MRACSLRIQNNVANPNSRRRSFIRRRIRRLEAIGPAHGKFVRQLAGQFIGQWRSPVCRRRRNRPRGHGRFERSSETEADVIDHRNLLLSEDGDQRRLQPRSKNVLLRVFAVST